MGFFRKRWAERSSRIQLLQLGALAASLGTGLPVEQLAGVIAAIAGLGVIVPDKGE